LHVIDVQNRNSPVHVFSYALGETSAYGLDVSGKHAVILQDATDEALIIDLGGLEANSLLAHSAEVGQLNVTGKASFQNTISALSGISIGSGGLQSIGALSVYASNTTSTFFGAVSTTRLSVGGFAVCLANGTNCGSLLTAESDTLATVTARGSSATTTLQFYGGFIGASSTVTSTFTVLGNTNVQNATATSLFASIVRGTNGSFTGLLQSDIASSTLFYSQPSDPVVTATHTTAGSISDVYVNGKYVYASEAAFAQWNIIDVTDPSFPSSTARTSTGGGGMGTVKVVGDYAYVANQGPDQLRIYDIRKKNIPVLVGTAAEGGEDIDVQGQYAYLLDTDEFSIIDISNPAAPRVTSNFATSSGDRVHVYGRYAYLSLTTNGLSIIDISDPAAPVPTGFFNPAGSVYDVIVSGNYAYVAADTDGIYILDISNPAAPRQMAQFNPTNSVSRLFLAGKYLYAAAGNLDIYDVSSSTNPILTETLNITGDVDDVFVQGRYAYLAENGKLLIVDLSGADIPTANIGSLFSQFVSISDSANIGHNLTVNNGLMVGEGGILSLGSIGVSATNTTSTFLGGVSSTRLSVGGFAVCLANGTNCQAAGVGTDLNWTYDPVSDFVRNATATTDIVLGSTATSTGAPAYFDLSGGTSGTSAFYFGHATNANVVIGGTSTTNTGLNALFTMNGNDLFVSGNIGSVSSVYTNGAFVAGAGSTYYGDGLISKTDGVLNINATDGVTFDRALTVLGAGTSNFTGTVSSTGGKFSGTVTSTSFEAGGGSLSAPGFNFGGAGKRNTGLYLPDGINPSISSAGTLTTVFRSAFTETRVNIEPFSDATFNLGAAASRFKDGFFSGTVSTTNLIASGSVSSTSVAAQRVNTLITGDRMITAASSVTVVGSPYQIIVRGNLAYVLSSGLTQAQDLLTIYDVTNPAAPSSTAQVSVNEGSARFDILGDFAFIANTSSQIVQKIDMRNKSSFVSTQYTQPGALTLKAVGRYLYV
ncbi:MAG: hypothetical protein NUW08_03435, partial [Candidatus Uhrbacteria bacterium]|nr:hypothetical protein [Candidatus Uhrbacteria bacterium]